MSCVCHGGSGGRVGSHVGVGEWHVSRGSGQGKGDLCVCGGGNVLESPNCFETIWDLLNGGALEGSDSGGVEFNSIGITPILN